MSEAEFYSGYFHISIYIHAYNFNKCEIFCFTEILHLLDKQQDFFYQQYSQMGMLTYWLNQIPLCLPQYIVNISYRNIPTIFKHLKLPTQNFHSSMCATAQLAKDWPLPRHWAGHGTLGDKLVKSLFSALLLSLLLLSINICTSWPMRNIM